jgi:hypothetical protein
VCDSQISELQQKVRFITVDLLGLVIFEVEVLEKLLNKMEASENNVN